MPLATLTKTWEFCPNYAIAATGTALGTNRTVIKWLVDNMTTNTATLWRNASNALVTPSGLATVDYSCDSVTAGTKGDGVNRWDSITDLVWANNGVAHSWVVLTLYGTSQMLISLEGAAVNGNTITLVISPNAGFTGGTTTARPTATDERALINNTTWTGLSSDGSVKVHLIKSTDGQCWRFLFGNGNQVSTAIILDKAVQFASPDWVNSLVGFAIGTVMGSNVLTNSNLNNTASFLGFGDSAMAMFLAGPAYAGAQANVTQNSANDLSGNWPFFGQELIANTASNRGDHGYLNDVWYGSTATASGSTTPTTGTQHQFIQIGSLIFPWCQVAAVLA